MDDELPGGIWQLDPETRLDLRLGRVRRALDQGSFGVAIIEAEELLDETPDNSDCLFLLGEALLEIGDPQIAARVYERHAELTGGEPSSLLGLAIARYEICDLVGAAEAAEEVVRIEPDNGEAHYYLGLAQELLPGRGVSALQSFASARQLDPERFPYPLLLSSADWHDAIRRAMSAIDGSFQDFWSSIPIRLEAAPKITELRSTQPPGPPSVTGMFVGDPPEEDDPRRVRPQALRLFTNNLARARDIDEVIGQISDTLEQEAMNWIGIVPDDP